MIWKKQNMVLSSDLQFCKILKILRKEESKKWDQRFLDIKLISPANQIWHDNSFIQNNKA